MQASIRSILVLAVALLAACAATGSYAPDGTANAGLIHLVGYGRDSRVISQISKITAKANGSVVYQLDHLPPLVRLVKSVAAADFTTSQTVPPGIYEIEFWCRFENAGPQDTLIANGRQTIRVQAGEAWAINNDTNYQAYSPPMGMPEIHGSGPCNPAFVQVPYPKS